jgi:hypothetical protein
MTSKYVFSQLVDFLPIKDFQYLVKKYNGNKGIHSLSCWNQLLKILFGQLSKGNSPKRYPDKIRKINYYDAEYDRNFIFLTNDFNSDASVIADLYRKSWGIELFFKWIKQHLKIKSFWGTTMNAVKIQVNQLILKNDNKNFNEINANSLFNK